MRLQVFLNELASCTSFVPEPSRATLEKQHRTGLQKMIDTFEFYIERCQSSVGGTGVFVRTSNSSSSVCVPKGELVAIYPGLLYKPSDHIFFQSIGNPCIFRCLDGILIDGNDKWISKSIFKSCVNRDKIDFCPSADSTWMTNYPKNPLCIGQYVNNQSKEYSSNVAYREIEIDIPLSLRRFVPHLWHEPSVNLPTRVVTLVATRDLKVDEELFSDYFTIVS